MDGLCKIRFNLKEFTENIMRDIKGWRTSLGLGKRRRRGWRKCRQIRSLLSSLIRIVIWVDNIDLGFEFFSIYHAGTTYKFKCSSIVYNLYISTPTRTFIFTIMFCSPSVPLLQQFFRITVLNKHHSKLYPKELPSKYLEVYP
jgi:hypothetical protein